LGKDHGTIFKVGKENISFKRNRKKSNQWSQLSGLEKAFMMPLFSLLLIFCSKMKFTILNIAQDIYKAASK
jgi:hypothetical protein